jgi:hypothetical protein
MLTLAETIKNLSSNLGRLPERDRVFARSLIDQSNGRGLTPKQRFWAEKLATRAAGCEAPATTVDVGDFAGVAALFATAAKHLKFPKIRLALPDGRPVALAVAGRNSRHPGTISVTDGERFGSNVWYGRIQPNGQWTPSDAVNAATMTSLSALLSRLSTDPAGTAAAYGLASLKRVNGRLTGNCCFCTAGIRDERSTSVGYGPICARHFGLPWGKGVEAPAIDDGDVGTPSYRRAVYGEISDRIDGYDRDDLGESPDF